MGTRKMVARRGDGPPVYSYQVVPGVPPVSAARLGGGASGRAPEAHAHDFFVLAYFERGGGTFRLGNRKWRVEAGDVYVIAPGELVGAEDPGAGDEAEGWAVFFPPAVFDPPAPGAFLSWRAHPLLFPFVRGSAGGAQRLSVPPEDRPDWTARWQALERELRERRDGYRDAVLAHLTLLLVEVSRLAADVAGDLRLRDEPLLADVFGYIEAHFHETISLKDVAWAVSLTPAHLTTVVRRKTGRTVQEWLTERRLAEARRLLVGSDLTVAEVGQRVGYGTSGYFVRSFRRAHGVTPLAWRRDGRP
jgi:AraC family transcriptional activator of pobA